jgi:hypothetical protein
MWKKILKFFGFIHEPKAYKREDDEPIDFETLPVPKDFGLLEIKEEPKAELVAPIRWKTLIPRQPTDEEFQEAWKLAFRADFSVCKIKSMNLDDGIISIQTPDEYICDGGLLIYHTDEPSTYNIWYSGGANWSRDRNNRYYYLDRETGLPYNWPIVKARETIKQYIANNIGKIIKQSL